VCMELLFMVLCSCFVLCAKIKHEKCLVKYLGFFLKEKTWEWSDGQLVSLKYKGYENEKIDP